MGCVIEELLAACLIHQRVEECIKVTSGGVSKQRDALGSSLVAQLPHLIPSGRDFPALLLEQALVVEQAAGRVEHRCQIGLTIRVRVGGRVIVYKAGDDLFAHGYFLAGNGHGQHIGDLGDVLILDELLGQASLTANCQMDDIRILAALHCGADVILELLVSDKLYLNTGLLGKGVADLLPDFRAVAGLDRSNLDGAASGRLFAVSAALLIGCATASGQQAQGHRSCQRQAENFLSLHHSFLPP